MTETKYAVPMYESERGWGSKIDGYAGPFPTMESADSFRKAFNKKNNSEDTVPDWYIVALAPEPLGTRDCTYRTIVDGVEYSE